MLRESSKPGGPSCRPEIVELQMRPRLRLLRLDALRRHRPFYDIVSALLGGGGRRARTCCGSDLLCRGLRGEHAFKRAAALGLGRPRRAVLAGLLEAVFGGAQSCFQRLELLCLCAHGLLPAREVSRDAGAGGAQGGRALLGDVLLEAVEVAVELEQAVELRHEVERNCPVQCQPAGAMLAPGRGHVAAYD
jgi:hypothetical protein